MQNLKIAHRNNFFTLRLFLTEQYNVKILTINFNFNFGVQNVENYERREHNYAGFWMKNIYKIRKKEMFETMSSIYHIKHKSELAFKKINCSKEHSRFKHNCTKMQLKVMYVPLLSMVTVVCKTLQLHIIGIKCFMCSL